jgi:hypothetical protein
VYIFSNFKDCLVRSLKYAIDSRDSGKPMVSPEIDCSGFNDVIPIEDGNVNKECESKSDNNTSTKNDNTSSSRNDGSVHSGIDSSLLNIELSDKAN